MVDKPRLLDQARWMSGYGAPTFLPFPPARRKARLTRPTGFFTGLGRRGRRRSRVGFLELIASIASHQSAEPLQIGGGIGFGAVALRLPQGLTQTFHHLVFGGVAVAVALA